MNELQRLIDATPWWYWVLLAHCVIGLLLFAFVMAVYLRRRSRIDAIAPNPVDPPWEDLHASHGGLSGQLIVLMICMLWSLVLIMIAFRRLKYGRWD